MDWLGLGWRAEPLNRPSRQHVPVSSARKSRDNAPPAAGLAAHDAVTGVNPTDLTQSMTGRVCLITGATAGIGEVTARGLALRGASVVITGRNHERCAAAVERIKQATGNPTVSFLCADLSLQSEVRRLAREFQQRHERLHVLINNAGALFALRRESADGIEMTLALNHLAPFLLTNLLLETMRASAPARIINVSSDAHEMVKAIDFDDPEMRSTKRRFQRYPRAEVASLFFALAAPRSHPALLQYARTKLANLLFTHELVRRLERTGVTANALHPGFVKTGFSAGNGTYGWLMRRGASLFAVSAEVGARTPIHLATSVELERVTGQYFVKQQPAVSSPASREAAAAERLWRMSAGMTTR